MDIWIIVDFNLTIEYRGTVLHALKNVAPYERMYKKGRKVVCFDNRVHLSKRGLS